MSTIPVEDVKRVLEDVQKAKKFAYICDLTGTLSTYFEYSGHVFWNFGALHKAVMFNTITKEEAAEQFRIELINCMQKGMHLVVNLNTAVVKFEDYDCETLPLTNMILDPEKLHEDYIQIVKDEENYDLSKRA